MRPNDFNTVPPGADHRRKGFIYVPIIKGDLSEFSEYFDKIDLYAEIPEEFDATLHVKGFAGGRSAANITFTDHYRGWTYYMGAHEAIKLIKGAMDNSESAVNGRFTIKKRGNNYRLYKVK